MWHTQAHPGSNNNIWEPTDQTNNYTERLQDETPPSIMLLTYLSNLSQQDLEKQSP